MQRFTEMLSNGFKQQHVAVETWLPLVVFGKGASSTIAGYGKWLGYIDKWVLFPLVLRRRLGKKKYKKEHTYFHICDHSNAPYLAYLPLSRASITCHDVLAIRGALGYADAYCPASSFGKILQQWILRNLLKVQRVATVSHLTFEQLQELAANNKTKIKPGWGVIHNAFNDHFYVMEAQERNPLLQQAGIDIQTPFLLHVGSSLTRKNRRMLIEMVVAAGDAWNGNIVFAGQALEEEMLELIQQHHLTARVIAVVQPDHATLIALYSTCAAFVFPSFSEGFGWPIIEAQACGAPVIASDLAPLPEVSGGAALHSDPNDPNSFAEALLLLQDAGMRRKQIDAGFENIQRFEPRKMIEQYMALMKMKSIVE